MKKIIKTFFIFLFLIGISFNTFSDDIDDLNAFLLKAKENEMIEGMILAGLNGYGVNPYYEDFMNTLKEVNVQKRFGNNIVVSKVIGNKILLLGHSIVALNYDSIKNEKVDIVGITGGIFDSIITAEKVIKGNYNELYVWIGINDIVNHSREKTPYDKFFEEVKYKVDTIYENRPNGAHVRFFLISPNKNPDYAGYIDIVNSYIKNIYDYIDVFVEPDQDNLHFTAKTFRTIFDNYVEPSLKAR